MDDSPQAVLTNILGTELAVQDGVAIPPGTPALLLAGKDGATARIINVDAFGNVTISGSITATNPSVDANAGAAPGFSTQIGGPDDAGNLQPARIYDGDTGAGVEPVLGAVLRKSAPGGSVEAGTAADPWYITAVALPLPTGAATETTLALIKAKTDNLDVALSTRATEATLATRAADATLTGGTQKAIARGGAKGATVAADVTSTAEGADHQAIDVQLYHAGAAVSPLTDAELRATPVPVSGPLTDAQLRASEVTIGGSGTAGTPAGGVLTIQGDPSGEPIPIAGSIVATNPSVGPTGSPVPSDATLIGASDGTDLLALRAAPASSTPDGTEPALIVSISPNTAPVPITGSITATNPSVGDNEDPVPVASTQIGGTDGTDLHAAHVFDADTGVGTEFVLGVGLRKSASGGSVEAGTATDPLRVDPTGDTPQPVTGPLTDAELRATPVPVSGPLTDTQLRASPVPISAAALPLPTGAATETTLALIKAKTDNLDVALSTRATEATLATRAADATLTGGTAKAIARGGAKGATVAADVTSTAEGADHQAIDVQLYHGGFAVSPLTDTQLRATPVPVSGPLTDAQLRASPVPISAAALPLPAGAATEATLALIKAQTDNLDVALSTRATEATLATRAADATLTGGTAKAIVRGGAKGATVSADVTSTAEGADHQAVDVQLYHGGAAISPLTDTQLRATAVPISAAALPLPAGAATETTLALIKAKTDNLDVALSTRAADATLTGGTAKAIARGGAKGATVAADVTSTAEGADHQAVDVQLYHAGTAISPLTDTQLRASAVPVSAVALPLPTGASTEATLLAAKVDLDSILARTPALGQAAMAASSPVVIASNQSDVPFAMGTVDPINTSIVPLAGAGVFTGSQYVSTVGSVSLIVFINADASGSLAIEWANDSAGTGSTTDPLQASNYTSGSGWQVYHYRIIAPYYRLVYTNGGAAQTSFYLTSVLSKSVPDLSLRKNDDYADGVFAPDVRMLPFAGSDGSNPHPIRVDTDGTLVVYGDGVAGTPSGGVFSVQGVVGGKVVPVSDGAGSLTIDTPQLPAALVGGRVDTNNGAWLGSTAPTVGSKVSASSLPVVVASDQIVPVSGPLTDAQLRATPVPVSGPLTDTQLRATPVPVEQGTAAAVGQAWPIKISDGAIVATLKAANTAAVTTDQALVVAISPNNTIPISAVALPLPAGAATESTLATMSAKLPLSLGQATMVNSLAVVIASNQTAVAVSGPLTDTQLRASAVPISAAALPLPTGASTETTLLSVKTDLDTLIALTPALGQTTMAGSSPMVIASDQSAVPFAGTDTDGTVRAVGADHEVDGAYAIRTRDTLALKALSEMTFLLLEIRDRLPLV